MQADFGKSLKKYYVQILITTRLADICLLLLLLLFLYTFVMGTMVDRKVESEAQLIKCVYDKILLNAVWV